MSTLVDTNILLRSIEPRHPMWQAASDSVQILRKQGEQLVLAPQNIYEFWVAATRPLAQNGLGLTPQEAPGRCSSVQVTVPGLQRFAGNIARVGATGCAAPSYR
jgi:hypothetical protein